MPGAAPFHDLSQDELRELLLRIRLYAQWKVRAASHRDATLDPQDLALREVADTLDGTRRFNAERFDLLRHLTNCIDSYVSHRYASAEVRREAPRVDGARAVEQVAAADGDPEAELSLEHDVRELRDWVARNHPRLETLLALVVERGFSLADRREVAIALGADPEVSAQMQRVYRQINALRDAVSEWQQGRGEAGS